MTARTVQGTVEFPAGSGTACVGARVEASLYAGGVTAYGTTGDVAVGGTATLTDNNGDWSLSLEPNVGITPAGTVWQVEITRPGGGVLVSDYIEVPDIVGPHEFTDILTEQPGALPSRSLVEHVAAVHAHGTDNTHVINIADLGAAADGVTDDSQAFADAYALAVAANRSSQSLSSNLYATATISIPAGTYLITEPESMMTDLASARALGLVYRGAGRGQTVINFQPSEADACLFRNSDDWLGLTVERISFVSSGDHAATATWMESDSDGGPQLQTFDRCNWTGDWKRGINLTGSNTNDTMVFYQCSALSGAWADAFLYAGPSDTSDQFLAFGFHEFKFEVESGAFVTLHMGGDVSIFGGSLIHTAAASESTMINLMGTSHAYGVCSFRAVGVRVEHRTHHSRLIYSEWPQGAVSFVNCDTTPNSITEPENADAITAEFAFTSVHGPAVEWFNCMLVGRHKYTSQINGWNGSHRVRYQGCELSTQENAHEFLVTENTGNAGGIPQIQFENCRGQAQTNNAPFDCTVNWEKQWKGRPHERRLSLKLQSGGSPTSSLPVATVLPVGSIIRRVWAVKGAGGTASGTNWSYTLADADATTIATLSASGTAWNTAWTRTSSDLYVLCDTTNKRTLTLSAANITESSAVLHIVIEYLA